MDRKIKGVGIGAGLATIVMWLLGYYNPDLMATAPTGLEAAVTAVIATLIGWLVPNDHDDNQKTETMVRSPVWVGLIALLMVLSGCAFIQEHESEARIATTYATLKVIDEDAERAARVVDIATEVSEIAGGDPEATVGLLIAEARDLIKWENLDAADTVLVDTLLIELEARLIDVLGDGILPDDARVTVQTIAEWVIRAASPYVSG